MLPGIDALIALQRFGTVSEAAAQLRLTQSAVSKRIRGLQDELGYRIVEPDGRRLRLTPQAVDFLARARPLLAELRGLKTPAQGSSTAHLSLALADSIASSWGPRIVRRALEGSSGLVVDLHSHRSVLVVESVRLGRYHLGLCTDPVATGDLIHHRIVDEPMVLLNAGYATKSGKRSGGVPLITVEASAASWKAIEPQVRSHHPALLQRQIVTVESFSAALQMAGAAFGDGLIPLGLVLEARIDRKAYRELPGVTRPVSLLTRKMVHQLTIVTVLRERLRAATTAYFAHRGPTRKMVRRAQQEASATTG